MEPRRNENLYKAQCFSFVNPHRLRKRRGENQRKGQKTCTLTLNVPRNHYVTQTKNLDSASHLENEGIIHEIVSYKMSNNISKKYFYPFSLILHSPSKDHLFMFFKNIFYELHTKCVNQKILRFKPLKNINGSTQLPLSFNNVSA